MIRITIAEVDAHRTLLLFDAFTELGDGLRKLRQEQPHLKGQLDHLIAIAKEGAQRADALADDATELVDEIAAWVGVPRCPATDDIGVQ
jgi:hypothetical protein